ncbi:hypothetical protein [Segatella salivae]
MDTSTMMNTLTMQRHGCYASSSMNISAIANVTTTQRCKRCTFYSSSFYHGIPRRKRTTPTALTSSLHA